MLFSIGLWGRAVARDLPPLEEVAVLSPKNLRYQAVQKETQRLREAADFAGLEALAAELRTSKESLTNGTWMLTYFYEEAVEVPRKDPAQADAAMKFYERWAAERPESITAQVSLASAYTDYAWAARGSGWADSVTDQGAALFEERLDKAWEVLQKAAELKETCPMWADVAQTVALGQGWDRPRYMKLVNEAIQREPTYGEYYKNAIYWLLPRWYGEPGDFEQWIAEKADENPQKDQHYARLVWQADSLDWPDEMVFAKGRLDWERTKRGFEVWAKEFPDSLPIRFEFFKLSLLAEDRATAREQLEITGGKYWKSNWAGHAERFEMARQFAYNNGPNPLRNVAPVARKTSPLSPQVLRAIKLTSWGLGGLIGGILCLVFACQRKRVLPGLFMFLVSIVLALLYGTIAAALPAGVFVLYLFSKEPKDLVEKPPQHWGITLLWVLAIMGFYLISQIVATIFAMIPAMAGQHFDPASATNMAAQLFTTGEGFLIVCNAQWLSLLLLLVVCGRQSSPGWCARLGFLATDWRRAILFLIVIQIAIVAAGYLLMFGEDARTKASMEMMAGGLQSPAIFLLTIVVLAPILEELVMRGYAFQSWLPKLGFLGTATLTTLIFTLSHVQYGWTGLAQVFLLGSALAWLRWKTGSVYPCIALHVTNNFLYFLALYFGFK